MTMDELVATILKRASAGIYREQLMNEFVGLPANMGMTKYLTKNHVAEGITRARQKGMCTIPDMRDSKLGTYYQYNEAK